MMRTYAVVQQHFKVDKKAVVERDTDLLTRDGMLGARNNTRTERIRGALRGIEQGFQVLSRAM